MTIYSTLLIVALGAFLGYSGLGLSDWRFYVVLVLVAIYGVLRAKGL